ncbi:DMT family transporter [Ramlibacter humi]|uniref:DMT family transporter n=1 Tax=Ramlibacter humi TaxID=2530451 RepID=A0A4Z0BR99_9BURK|nr:DMT family transporter [Ramlibacter humi]TFZ01833.1 DMT family transporter [Ramlibacter humi]
MAGPEGPRAAAVAALVFNAFVWGVSWWPFRELQSQGLHPLWATCAVYLFSLLVVTAMRPGLLRAVRSHPALLWLMLASGCTNVGFNWAVTVGDVVRVVLLFYLMPAWSVLLAWPLLGERPQLPALVRLALALAGVVVILKTPETPWPVPQSLPDVLAILGGFSFALVNILVLRLRGAPAIARVTAMFTGGTLAAAAAGTIAVTQGLAPSPTLLPIGAAALALVLGVGFLLGNAAMQFGASRLPAQTTALVMLSEVLFASVSSVAAGAATLGPRTLAGGALVLAAAAWSALSEPGTKSGNGAQSPA